MAEEVSAAADTPVNATAADTEVTSVTVSHHNSFLVKRAFPISEYSLIPGQKNKGLYTFDNYIFHRLKSICHFKYLLIFST